MTRDQVFALARHLTDPEMVDEGELTEMAKVLLELDAKAQAQKVAFSAQEMAKEIGKRYDELDARARGGGEMTRGSLRLLCKNYLREEIATSILREMAALDELYEAANDYMQTDKFMVPKYGDALREAIARVAEMRGESH